MNTIILRQSITPADAPLQELCLHQTTDESGQIQLTIWVHNEDGTSKASDWTATCAPTDSAESVLIKAHELLLSLIIRVYVLPELDRDS